MQSYRSSLESKVSRYTPEDWGALHEFLVREFGPDSIQADPAFFRWRFLENPYADPRAPQVWLYRDGGRVRGMQAGLPVRLKAGSRELRAAWAIDLRVEEAYRRKGVGAILTKALTRDNDLTMGLGITEDAGKAFRRAGWQDGGEVPLYMTPLDVYAILHARWQVPCSQLLGYLANLCAAWLRRVLALRFRLRRFSLAKVERFDETADRLWADVSRSYPVACRRDARYLNWRFADYPVRGRYGLFHLECRGTPVGCLVTRLSSRHGLSTGLLVDWVLPPPMIVPALLCCARYFRKWGASAFYCLARLPATHLSFWRAGVLRRTSMARMMWMPSPNAVDTEGTHLLASEPWFVCSGDGDADRPTVADQSQRGKR